MPVADIRPQQQLVLASGSARRRDLLRQIGIEPSRVDPPHVDEHPGPRELPLAYAARMAREKLAAIAPKHPGCWVVAADTVVACGRRLTVRGCRRDTSLAEGARHHHMEIAYSRFERTISLPEHVDSGRVELVQDLGMLLIRIEEGA